MRDIAELSKLEEYLKENGFVYERTAQYGMDPSHKEWLEWNQIKVFEDDRLAWDVVCHSGSYGFEDGVLEGMGPIFGHGNDNIEGWLTAADVIRKIEGRNNDKH